MDVDSNFGFPFTPYEIQLRFMEALYSTLDDGKIGIFESPTGTGKSLSIICGALKWLEDHIKKQEERIASVLSGKSEICASEQTEEPSWVDEFFEKKTAQDEMEKAKQSWFQSRLDKNVCVANNSM